MARRSRASGSSHAPGAGWRRAAILLFATALGRTPVTVFPVLFILQSQVELGRYDIGGFAVLAYSVGSMVNGLLAGWLFAIFGHRAVTIVTGALTSAALLVSAAESSVVAYLVLAGIIGLCFPPLHIGSRAIYPRLLGDTSLLRVYSIDVSIIQITWIIAPVLVVALAGVIGIPMMYVVLAALTAIGSLWYFLLAGVAPRRGSTGLTWAGVKPLLRDGRMHVYLFVAGGLMAVSGLILPLLLAIMPSSVQQSTAIMVWSIGSAAGSLLVNRNGARRVRLAVGLSIAVVALLTAATINGVVITEGALFILGFATAPVAAAVFFFTSQHFRSRHQVLVFGIITSVQLVAEGVGTSVSGVLIDAGMDIWVWVGIVAILIVVVTMLWVNARAAFIHAPIVRTDVISVVVPPRDPHPRAH